MVSRKTGRITSRAKFIALVAISMGLTTTSYAACFPPESRLPQDQIQSFLNNPTGLLASNPSGGIDLSGAVLNLVASDNSALPAVIQLLSSATPEQRVAIGKGLAYAARACLGSDQAFAGEIQSQLAATGALEALTAFVSTGGQEPATAATGAGAPAVTAFTSGYAQVSGNSPIINNTAPVIQPIGSTGSGVNPFTFNGGSGGAAAASRNSSP